MAVKVLKREEEELVLELNNGDREKLQEVMTSWKFKDEESFIRFALVIMLESYDKKTIAYTTDQSGILHKFQPATTLLKDR